MKKLLKNSLMTIVALAGISSTILGCSNKFYEVDPIKFKNYMGYLSLPVSEIGIEFSDKWDFKKVDRNYHRDLLEKYGSLYSPESSLFLKKYTETIKILLNNTHFASIEDYTYSNDLANLRSKFVEIRSHNNLEKILKNNELYIDFENDLGDIYKFPNKDGFLNNYMRKLASDVRDKNARKKRESTFYDTFGVKLDLNNPSNKDKISLFFEYLISEGVSRNMISHNAKLILPGGSTAQFTDGKNRYILDKFLSRLVKQLPINDLRINLNSVKKYPSELSHYLIDYSPYLDFDTNDLIPIIGGHWDDLNGDGKKDIYEIEKLHTPLFEDDHYKRYARRPVITLGVYSMSEQKPVSDVIIKVFGDDASAANREEDTYKENPVSISPYSKMYTIAFIVNNKVWQVRQITSILRRGPEADLLYKTKMPIIYDNANK